MTGWSTKRYSPNPPEDAVKYFQLLEAALASEAMLTGAFEFDFLPMAGTGAEYDRLLISGNIEALTVVPLPAALPLFLSGLVMLGAAAWRRRAAAVIAT